MNVKTLVVSRGFWRGEKPMPCNQAIIQTLREWDKKYRKLQETIVNRGDLINELVQLEMLPILLITVIVNYIQEAVSTSFNLNLEQLLPKPTDHEAVDKACIGEGGFGKVYAAIYQHDPVAVKILIPKAFSLEARDHFKNECELLENLRHPNICRLFGYTFDEQNACLVMELAELGSLYSILRDTTNCPMLPWKLRLSIAKDIAAGVYILHSRVPPIIHRDLKSCNVLLRGNWEAFVVDFGLAKIKFDSQIANTAQVGSYPWLAPELYEPGELISQAVDVYSFGMILFELLTRQLPWQGLTQYQVCRALDLGHRPVIPDETDCPGVEGCPTDYIKLMGDCWAQDPADRPIMKSIAFQLAKMQEIMEHEEPENS